MLFSRTQRPYQNNWARNVAFSPAHYLFPKDLDDLMRDVRRAFEGGHRIRVIGSGHSFTPVAACSDTMISLDSIQGLKSVDHEKKQATFWAGTKMSLVGPLLEEQGLAISTMGDIDQQSIAGALQTGTHGTGVTLTCLSGFVVELCLLLPHGEMITCSKEQNQELFNFARIALGTLGIVVSVTLQCVDNFSLQDSRWPIPFSQGLSKSEELAQINRHYEFFWFPYTKNISAKTLNISPTIRPRNWLSAYLNDHLLENIVFQGMCTLAYNQSWLTKSVNQLSAAFLPSGSYADVSFKVFPTVRKVRFSEMEFSVPIDKGLACLQAIKKFIESRALRIFLPIEYRYVAADDIPLSPFFGRDSVTISLHAYGDLDQTPYFEGAQEIFLKYEGRPHWGKIHSLKSKSLSRIYERLDAFRALRKEIDPRALFLTPYLQQLLSS